MNTDWKRAYGSTLEDIRQKANMILGRQPGFSITHTTNPDVLRRIRDGETAIETSNVSGCCMCMKRALIDEIGRFDDRFHPYGNEDREFSIRVLKNGRSNYVYPKVAMFHGFDERQETTQDFKSMKQMIEVDLLLRLSVLDGAFERTLSFGAYALYALIRRGLRAVQSRNTDIFTETVVAISNALTIHRTRRQAETDASRCR